jgi:nitroimidazol reductase NimA-like FMN-containing flavoprotein (pyridoxamine 5'-phosphate oxidase superfamily)
VVTVHVCDEDFCYLVEVAFGQEYLSLDAFTAVKQEVFAFAL